MSVAEFVYTVLLKPPPLRHLANATIKAIVPAHVRVGDALIWLNPADPVVSGALSLRVYEREEMAFFRSIIGGGMTFVDVGANVGLYTALALATPGFTGRILAIEPHAESRIYLAKTIASNNAGLHGRQVDICAAAASDRAGRVTLYKNPNNKCDNRLYADPLLGEREEVSTDTLDNICVRQGIDSIQFLKIDVQGSEAQVVQGASDILSRSSDCVLMTEFWPYGLERAGADASGYIELLHGLGFTLFRLTGKSPYPVPLGDPRALVAALPGRCYANLIGLKGELYTLSRLPLSHFRLTGANQRAKQMTLLQKAIPATDEHG